MIPDEPSPLTWPWWWARTKPHQRKHSPYQVSFTTALEDLQRELKNGGVRKIVLSSNLPSKASGLPYATYREPADPGVALWYVEAKGESRVIPCDCWKTVRDNLRAIGLCYASLRQIQRTGASQLTNATLDVFRALPPAQNNPTPWEQILELRRPTTRRAIHDRFRHLSTTMHPDRGGDQDAFSKITAAYHQALKETPE